MDNLSAGVDNYADVPPSSIFQTNQLNYTLANCMHGKNDFTNICKKTLSHNGYRVSSRSHRVSTNLIKQISRRFPGDSRGILRKIQDMFALLRPPSESWNTHSFPQPNRNLGERQKVPTGVRGRASAENGFWCIWNLKNTSDGDKFRIFATNIYDLFIFLWLEANAVDLRHLTHKFPGGPIKFQEISKISRSCRHPVTTDG